MTDLFAAERAGARFIVSLALVAFAAAMVWFAWVDAPITDAAMDCVAAAGLACGIATVTGLFGYATTLQSSGATAALVPWPAPVSDAAVASAPQPAITVDPLAARRSRRIARLRRVAVLALAVELLLLTLACTVTLNLRGTGDDDSDSQTSQTAHRSVV